MTTSANGTPEGPLPSDIPTDADHMIYERKKHTMSNLYESEVEYFNGKPKPPQKKPRSAETLLAEVMMWRARARQNRAELRAANLEHAAKISELNSNCKKLRLKAEAAQARVTELEGATND
ncbi:hypothetical protein [Nesterenkonia jeotgali]|uniref:Uncharacterized protein n=1 Tax=Nesterenkonia jeotgali TaxID=317018 RepID=A0A839FN40_9MICC|nr:hypothetical protein [Nesterenkonia jeotgali]MBA8920071.1 hypothetical protein [Nesterenkonia jeotgali]